MSSLSLNTGLKALLSAQYVLDTVGHNLANANTRGYSRQRVGLDAALALPSRGKLIGTGVDVGRIERSVDELLSRRIGTQKGVFGGLGARFSGLSELESFFGASEENALSGLLDNYFTSVSDLSTAPSDPILRTGMVQTTRTLTSRFHEVSGQLAQSEREVGSELRARTSEVNSLAEELAAVNSQIARANSRASPVNDLLDKRDLLVEDLSNLVDLTVIDGANSTVGVLVAGNTLVGQTRANHMSVAVDNSGEYQIEIEGTGGYVPVTGGAVGGLLQLAAEDIPALTSRFDQLAHQLILAVNRQHSTGIPPSGSFTILTSENLVKDYDGDGKATDELLSNTGLPFEVTAGSLYINVEDKATGDLTKHRIDVSATHTTVNDFVADLNAIENLSADVDATGRLRIVADSGYGFDFTNRLDPTPDAAGSFGSASATLATGAPGPYGLADGDTLTLTADPLGTPVSFSLTFDQADFVEISQATAAEVADVINADPGAQANGIVADASNGTLVLRTLAEGTNANFEVTGGTAVGGLGWTGFLGTAISGHSTSVEPTISGSYTGTSDDRFTFRPNQDGTIGTTVGLQVDVFNQVGDRVGTVDVGSDYVPGTELHIANGVSVSFGLGELSATHGDQFSVDLVSDPDTTDALVALGLNTYFQGTNASDIDLREDIALDPTLISSSASGSEGDSQILIGLLSVKEADQGELGGSSLGQFYGDIVSELGFQTASTRDALSANETVILSLEQRRDQVSGVNVDEELVDMVAFEQAFQAASRYISVINQLNDELLALL